MPRPLPQTEGAVFLTDGGLETTLVFHDGLDLPCFAAFPLLLDDEGRQRLRRYFEPYLRTAAERGVGFVLDTPTWRANPDWGNKMGYLPEQLVAINRAAVVWADQLRSEFGGPERILINGVIGPRGDGYQINEQMSPETAERYHGLQMAAFSEADMVSALTMTYVEEAIGIARAAQAQDLPVVVSFTVETDGRLASGESLDTAIGRVDDATGGVVAYYMINCAHPSHFDQALMADPSRMQRVRGVRANASAKSHAELDEATELDAGDPMELAGQYRQLRRRFSQLSVLGGCCGTDHRHIAAIADACLSKGH